MEWCGSHLWAPSCYHVSVGRSRWKIMWTTITNYWVEILLTVTSIIVGFLVGYAFYRLQKRDVASARVERVKRAKEELLDIIESQIINKQQFAEELIHNLIVASEREHQVGLKDFCTPVTLLQDVALRLQKSRQKIGSSKPELTEKLKSSAWLILSNWNLPYKN